MFRKKTVFGMAAVLCAGCLLGSRCGREVAVKGAEELQRIEADKAAREAAEKAAAGIKVHPEPPRTPPEPRRSPNPEAPPIGLGKIFSEDELKNKVAEKIKACGGKASEDALGEVVKKSLQAAGDAYEKPGGTSDSAWQAARTAAKEEANKQGSSLPVGFAMCVSGISGK